MAKNRNNRGTLQSNVVYAYSESDKSLLTVSTAPFTIYYIDVGYLNLSEK